MLNDVYILQYSRWMDRQTDGRVLTGQLTSGQQDTYGHVAVGTCQNAVIVVDLPTHIHIIVTSAPFNLSTNTHSYHYICSF